MAEYVSIPASLAKQLTTALDEKVVDGKLATQEKMLGLARKKANTAAEHLAVIKSKIGPALNNLDFLKRRIQDALKETNPEHREHYFKQVFRHIEARQEYLTDAQTEMTKFESTQGKEDGTAST